MSAGTRVLDRAPADWASLLAADPGALPSQRPELWSAFVAALPGHELRVVVAEDGGVTLGGAPVLLERRGGLCWLHALPRLLPGTPLALAGRHDEVDAAVARGIAGLAREQRVVGGTWACYRPHGPRVPDTALGALPGETRWFDAAVIELGAGLDAAFARFDRKQRQAIQHPRLRGLEFASAPAHFEAAWALHLDQARAWSGYRPLAPELGRRLLEAGGAQPVARLFALTDASGVLSAAFALDGPRETFLWWSGTHAQGRRRGAFALLVWRIAEWAAAAGRSRINLGASTGLAGVSSFKHGLGTVPLRYPVRWLDARHAPPLGRAAAWLQQHVRRGRQLGERA